MQAHPKRSWWELCVCGPCCYVVEKVFGLEPLLLWCGPMKNMLGQVLRFLFRMELYLCSTSAGKTVMTLEKYNMSHSSGDYHDDNDYDCISGF